MISPESESKLEINLESFFSPENLKVNFAQLLKDTTDMVEKVNLTRSFLQLMVFMDPDNIEGLFNIKVVEKNSNRPSSEDCFTYLVGREVNIQEFHDEMFETHQVFKEPIPGALALYFKEDKEEGLKATHIGKVTEDLTVISKWGLTGHVYEHLPQLVPISYGSLIAYYVSPKA